jgi:NAD(P)-dependent dehydrogenase (short-subunit alcohol dehydrogenase family)
MNSKILVTGQSSGLGFAIAKALEDDGHEIIPFSGDVRKPRDQPLPDALDVLINCAGVNRIDWLEDVSEADWDEVMDTNAKGIFMMTQWALPRLIESKGVVINIVSNAAHVPMTCSLAYNASKAAAWIMTQQLARELTKKHGITVLGIASNKLAGTGMSRYIEERVLETRGWTAEQARNYQLAALPAGTETPLEAVAGLIAYLLDDKENHRYLTGCIIPYGG